MSRLFIQIPASIFSPRRRRGLLFSFGFLFLVLYTAFWIFYFVKPSAVTAAWFDDSWAYRNAIPISSHTAAETNVYISATIDTSASGQFQSDCGDLRFTDSGGNLLPYFIVSGCTTATTVVHVFFDSFPAGAQTIYYYYGNPSAANGFSASDFATQATNYAVGTVASQEKTVGPVAYWKFDDASGTSAQDSTANNLDGTVSNATWRTEDQCLSGKCLYFDGSGDKVEANYNVLFDNTTGVTINAWIKTSTTSSSNIIFSKYGASGSGLSYMLVVNGDGQAPSKLSFYSKGWHHGNTAINDGRWHFVSATTNGSTWQIYVDGKLDASGGTSAINTSNSTATIGGPNSNNWGSNFTGFLDEPKIYPYARTAAQIKADYKSRGTSKGVSASLGSLSKNLDALSNGLVGYWKTDEATWSGTLAEVIDSSGNGNHGQAQGATGGKAYPTAGKFGNGGFFDGVDDYINLGNGSSLQITGDITLSAWIKTSDTQGAIIDDLGSAPYTSYGVWVGGSTAGKLGWYDTAWRESSTSVNDNIWHHVAVTVTNNTLKFFIDGTQDANTYTVSARTSTTDNKAIGARADGAYLLLGTVDEARVYNRALSPREVRDLYNWSPGSVGYWNLDEGTGTTSVNDSSGNGYTGTMNGSMTNSDWVTGKVGKGLETDTNDYISTSLNISGYKQGSYSLWVKNLNISDSNYGYLFQASSGSSCNLGMALIRDSINMRYFVRSDTQTISITGTNNGLVLNQWQHVALTWDTGSAKLYVNGVLQGTDSTVDFSDTTLGNVRFSGGYCSSANTNSEVIDDIRVYNYARTQKQIVEDMNAGHPAVGSPVGSQVLYYKLDEGYGQTTYDSSPSQVNGSLSIGATGNQTTVAQARTNGMKGKFNKGVDFDGTDDELDVTYNSKLNLPSDFSFSFWVYNRKASGTTDPKLIMRQENYLTNGYRVWITQANKFQFATNQGGGTVNVSSIATLATGQWYHLAVTYSGTTATLYINGKKDNSGTGTYVASTSNITIAGNGDSRYYLNAILDEVKIYNYALTSDEVALDYNHGSAMVLGTLSTDSSGAASSSAERSYCVPGDSTSCNPPIGYWNFNEHTGTTINDSSGNGNIVSITGSPAWTTGKFGSALSFNGSTDRLNVTATTALQPLTFSIEFWMYPTYNTTQSDWKGIVTGPYGNGYSNSWRVLDVNNGIYLQVNVGDAAPINCITAASTAPRNTWSHIAAYYDQQNLRVFINGVQRCSTAETRAINYTTSSPMYLGYAQFYFQGRLDDIKFFNYARTAAQIAWDYNRGGPVGWWKFDECQGTTANDSSGNGNSGTITIGATGTNTSAGTCTGSAGEAWKDGATGKFNSSLEFDGTDDYVSTGDSPSLDMGKMSISAWIKTSRTTGQYISERNNNTYYFATGISSNKLCYYINGVAATWTCTTKSVTDNSWHHVTGTWDGTNKNLYVDGVLDTSVVGSGGDIGNAAVGINIGYRNSGGTPSGYFLGQIDDVRIYNYALTATQVKTEYNQGSAIRFGPSTGSP